VEISKDDSGCQCTNRSADQHMIHRNGRKILRKWRMFSWNSTHSTDTNEQKELVRAPSDLRVYLIPKCNTNTHLSNVLDENEEKEGEEEDDEDGEKVERRCWRRGRRRERRRKRKVM
jgi:hypothetical protein